MGTHRSCFGVVVVCGGVCACVVVIMEEIVLREKCKEYDTFLQDRLVPELEERKRVLAALRKEKKSFEDAASSMQSLIDSRMGHVDTLVDLGAGCSMRGHVPSLQTVLVNVGMGFHVEMSLQEALTWATQRAAEMDKPIEDAARSVAETGADIRVALASIHQLLPRSLSPQDASPPPQ